MPPGFVITKLFVKKFVGEIAYSPALRGNMQFREINFLTNS
jgi:hypothetical protein